MTTYCVIGSNAFSGQDFIDRLLDDPGARVLAVSRSPERPDLFLRYRSHPNAGAVRFVQADLNRDMDALLAELDAQAPEYIVNFAAQSEVAPSWDHPEHWYRTNTVALARLVNHLRRRDYLSRYLHVSSPEAYGTCVGRVTEDSPLNPSTPYAASKAAADQLLGVFHRQFGFPVVTVRATNVYGARQQLFKIVCRTAIYLKLGRKIQLHGGGTAVKSYIHIRDVSEGERAILHAGTPGQVYHLSPDAGIAVRDVVRIICERMGRRFEDCTETVAERPGQDAAYVIDSTKARQSFGWAPRVTLDQGLGEVAAWIDAHWDTIRTLPHDYQHRA